MMDNLEQQRAELIAAIINIDLRQINEIANYVYHSLFEGGIVMVAGCGGSAGDAQHFVAELVGNFENRGRKPLRAVALTTDSSILTAVANDSGFENVFARQVFALGKKNDILILMSTSGRSKSVLNAAETAKHLGIFTIGLTGPSGNNTLIHLVDYHIAVETFSIARIQEVHQFILHGIAYVLDNKNWNLVK